MAQAMHENDEGIYRRVEVITGKRRRRDWTYEEKARIVAESYVPGVNISEVARRNGVVRGLLGAWRRQTRELAASALSEPMFAEVRVAEASREIATSVVRARGNKPPVAGMIEIAINGALVRVPAGVDRETLDTVITALRRTQ